MVAMVVNNFLDGNKSGREDKSSERMISFQGYVIAHKKYNIDEFLMKDMLMPKKVVLNDWLHFRWCCFLCAHRSYNYKMLCVHLSQKHGIRMLEDRRYQCGDCARISDDYAFFLNHVRSNHQEKLRLCCDICSVRFETYDEIANHRYRRHVLSTDPGTTRPNIIHCSNCVLCFSNIEDFENHIKEHNIIITKNSYEELVKHTFAKFQENKFCCQMCPDAFRTLNGLEKHNRTHIETSKAKISATESKKSDDEQANTPNSKETISTEKDNNKQVTKNEGNEKEYKCRQCLARFPTPTSLKAHTRIHLSQGAFKCTACTQTFSTSQQLSKHSASHDGKATLRCGKCYVYFKTHHLLKRHIINHCLMRKWKK